MLPVEAQNVPINAKNKPTWLPPQPFLNLGVKTRLFYERLRAKSEI